MQPIYSLYGKKIWVAGHRGMVGGALLRRLRSENCELVTVGRDQLDLRRQDDVEHWLSKNKPDCIMIAAATVGGIYANQSRPAEFIYDNLMIASNIIESAYRAKVEKLLFLGSSCIYPKFAAQPMAESCLLTGELEPTNQWYAVAKIAGIKLCDAYRQQYGCDYISAMPCNLYGLGDNYTPMMSHVIPGLIRRFHEAVIHQEKAVDVWGSGSPTREFLFSEDLADALVFLMKHYSQEGHINVGSGKEISIKQLAEMVARIVGFKGDITFNSSMPDGHQRKVVDNSKIHALGWKAGTSLEEGLTVAYQDFKTSVASKGADA